MNMNNTPMKITKKITGPLLGSYLLFVGLGMAVAQEPPPPPKVLGVFREFVKPGKSGSVHEKSESAFVQAMTRAKWPTHYLAVTAITGKPRVLFLDGIRFVRSLGKGRAGDPGQCDSFRCCGQSHGGRRRTPERHRYHRPGL